MPTPEWLDYMTGDVQAPPLDVQMRILSCLAAIASGSNPDGTPGPAGNPFAGLEASNILDGFQSVTATTAATTILTVPIGGIWVGTITIQCGVTVTGAVTTTGNAQCILSVSGAGATPAAGNYFQCNALAGANVVAGVTGTQGDVYLSSPFTIAAGGVAALLQSTVSITGATTGVSNVSAIGTLVNV
jgi:hypothetical protein